MRFRIIIILLLENFGIVTWKRLDGHPIYSCHYQCISRTIISVKEINKYIDN